MQLTSVSGAFSLGSSSSPASSKSDFVSLQTGGVKITAIKHTQQKFKSNRDLLSRLLVAAEEDNSSDNDQNGWDCDDNANDGT